MLLPLYRIPGTFLIMALIMLPACQREKSNKPPGYLQSAETAENRSAPAANESVYESVLRNLEKNPENIKALYHLAELNYRDGRYKEAVENYRKVLDRQPARGFVYLRLGTSLNRLGRYEEALAAFNGAVNNMDDPALAYNNMGITYGQLGRFQEEIEALRKAISARPSYASARYNLGVTLLKTGDVAGARRQAEALNEIDLTMAEALNREIAAAVGVNNR